MGKGKSGMSASGGSSASSTSTGGKLVKQISDQWYGENDNGSWAVINNSGKSDYNLYKYGNKQIYEVDRGVPTAEKAFTDNPPRLYAYTLNEAKNYAKGWLKANK